MDVNEDLRQTWVLLHPDVYYDEANACGCVGLITLADVDADRFDIDIGGKQQLFASDYLMVLREPEEIYQGLMDNRERLDKQALKDLYAVYLLRCSADAEHYRRALETASANPAIREHTLVTLEEKLCPRTTYHFSRGR